MKTELDRVKNDLETMQKAMGLSHSMGSDWIQWMKRDRWFSLWWCVPGLILIAAAIVPYDRTELYWGMPIEKWAGILVATSLLLIAFFHSRKVARKDGRPADLVRETKRVNGMTTQGIWFGAALLLQVAIYFIWGNAYHVAFEPFWAGLFLLTGSSCLVAALAAKAWTLLGYAIPFLAYALCLPLVPAHGKASGVMFGLMFIAVALSFSLIAVIQVRVHERQHAAD